MPRFSRFPFLAVPALFSLGHAQVTLKEGTYAWKTWNIVERADHGIVSQSTSSTLTRNFKTYVLENEYLTVTVLPEYGGRILSILNKATGRESLFQNPTGYADGIGAGNFYYNWLMVLGGIFPTFPEPEHGKTYLLPWKAEVTAQGSDKVSIEMSITDNINFGGRPGRFNLGVTGLTCIATVTLQAGRAAVDLHIELRNDKAQSVRYEYWTCTSLAPGSTPGDTKAPGNSEMVVPIDRYSVGFGTDGIDRAVSGGREYKNLAWFKNWTQPGIAYAEPAVTKPWWGAINHDNGEGIFRLVDDPKVTPGLKFWTWGYKSSYNMAGPQRQFLELWAGHGHQFFSPTTIAAHASKKWVESYAPTVNLKAVTGANLNALVSLKTDKAAYDGNAGRDFRIEADIVSLTPGRPFRAVLSGSAAGDRILLDTVLTPSPKEATALRLTRPLSSIGPGAQTLALKLESPEGKALLEAAIPLTVTNVTLGARPEAGAAKDRLSARVFPDGRAEFRWRDGATGAVTVYDAGGRRLP
jgi:hypothetical protein